MQTLIIYDGKYGFTETCVHKLASLLGNACIVKNVKDVDQETFIHADGIILGSPVYMGQLTKKMKRFAKQNQQGLLEKKVGLFVTCGMPEQMELYLNHGYSSELIKNASVKGVFGGMLNIDDMTFIHRMITQMMVKISEKDGRPLPSYIEGSIETFYEKWTLLK